MQGLNPSVSTADQPILPGHPGHPDHPDRRVLPGTAKEPRGLKVPLPLLFMLLMLLVILAVFDILRKSQDVHEEANLRVAKAALEIALARTHTGLNGIAARLAADQRVVDGPLPEVYFTSEAPAVENLAERTLILSFSGDGTLAAARVGQRQLNGAAVRELAAQQALSRPFAPSAGARQQANPPMVLVEGVPFILSDPQSVAGSGPGSRVTHIAVALPARDLLFDELKKYEVFGSGQLKRLLEQEIDLSGLADMIVGLQKKDYAQFHFSAVAQIVIVLAAFVIAVMIGHHIDRSNDALRQSRDAISDREREAQRLRLEAEQASESKSLFIQNMSHELRTPLNAVIGFSEIIADQKLGHVPSAYHDCAREINTSGKSLLTLINDILDLSRIESGSEIPVEEEIEIRRLIEEVAQGAQTEAVRAGVALQVKVPNGLPSLYSDSHRVMQVMAHLVDNAVKFTEAGGQVTVSVLRDPSGGLRFEVVDTGVGMAPEDLSQAFALFGQVDGKHNRRHEGSGLGLPLAKSNIELLGGSLELQSEAGVGTRVTVVLPVRAGGAKSAA